MAWGMHVKDQVLTSINNSRASKIRCDGQKPCASVGIVLAKNQRESWVTTCSAPSTKNNADINPADEVAPDEAL